MIAIACGFILQTLVGTLYNKTYRNAKKTIGTYLTNRQADEQCQSKVLF